MLRDGVVQRGRLPICPPLHDGGVDFVMFGGSLSKGQVSE